MSKQDRDRKSEKKISNPPVQKVFSLPDSFHNISFRCLTALSFKKNLLFLPHASLQTHRIRLKIIQNENVLHTSEPPLYFSLILVLYPLQNQKKKKKSIKFGIISEVLVVLVDPMRDSPFSAGVLGSTSIEATNLQSQSAFTSEDLTAHYTYLNQILR